MADVQRSLFDADHEADLEAKRHARRTDPESSHEAAAELVESGRVNDQCQRVLEALQRFDRTTSAELAWHSGMDRFVVARRLPDLERKGLAKKGGYKHCPVGGRKAVWWTVTGDIPAR